MQVKANNEANTLIVKPWLVRACRAWMPIFSSWELTVSIKDRYCFSPHHSSKLLGFIFFLCHATKCTPSRCLVGRKLRLTRALTYPLSAYTHAPLGKPKVSSYMGVRSCKGAGSTSKSPGKAR